ncbi:MAG: glycosyltransferase family A protein [Chitinophagales bacterium]|nr:glycosyltransferase family A protein [Chitinophagales bacterium]
MIFNNILSVPGWVKEILSKYDSSKVTPKSLQELKFALGKFRCENPEVSIVIPAYNEEKDILRMLASFARMKTDYKTELIVVNNNSKDRTKEILENLGVNVIDEMRQGISYTRQTGLEQAKGKYLLNADGDSLYPDGWINCYVETLKNEKVTCVYGTYSFFPSATISRFELALYEAAARLPLVLRKKKMNFFNVYGFNFAFRRDDGLRAGGFNTQRQRWSDGWMAMMLSQSGEVVHTPDVRARVWTSDRRIVIDGGIIAAVKKRLKKETNRYTETPDFHGEIENYKQVIKKA